MARAVCERRRVAVGEIDHVDRARRLSAASAIIERIGIVRRQRLFAQARACRPRSAPMWSRIWTPSGVALMAASNSPQAIAWSRLRKAPAMPCAAAKAAAAAGHQVDAGDDAGLGDRGEFAGRGAGRCCRCRAGAPAASGEPRPRPDGGCFGPVSTSGSRALPIGTLGASAMVVQAFRLRLRAQWTALRSTWRTPGWW